MVEGQISLFPAAFFSTQWVQISEGLGQVAQSQDAASLRSSLQAISSDANFHATRAGKPDFEAVLDYIPESSDFFARILPKIVGLAEEAATKFRCKDVPLLIQGLPSVVFLTYSEVATLLALAFLGLLPNGASISPLYFPKDGCAFPPNTEKLRCFLNYFDQLDISEADSADPGDQGMRITRIVRSDPGFTLEDLERSPCFLCKVLLRDLRQGICGSPAPLHVDFANARVGGGIFLNAPGATAQEEITFATHPELCAATVLCEVLRDDEALLIQGARHFCRHNGFLDTFSFLEGVKRSDPDFLNDAVQVVIDARIYDSGGMGRPYRYDHKLQVEDAQRDLQKAFIGFQGALQVYPASRSCATGNWGCGAFGGSAAVKVFIQWMAASLAGLESLEYFPWDDGVIHQFLSDSADVFSEATGGQTDMTFFNNSAHASGFGWHLKPPHAPPTLNNFKSFTAFRCNTGMFYYGTGNIFHDDHRFIECGTGHFMNHLSNNLHTAPFYHNLVLVGNIDPYAMHSRMGRGIRSAKDNEYFYVSGVTSINLHESAAFEGCFQTTCTMRYERARWFNSSKRTYSDSGKMAGIFWDLDGTLTGYPNGFVSKYFEFNTFPGKCNVSSEHVNGVVCGAADGSLRVRTMKVNNQEPWQLDGKQMNVLSSSGFDQVSYDFFKVKGWAFPMVENETYDMRVNDPNDFQRLTLQYSVRPYVMEAHGYGAGPSYTNTTPKSEDVLVHLNYTDWRDHFDGTTGERLSRMPTSDDPFGSFSMILRQDQCDAFNLTESAQEKCGGYVNDTGLELKAEIDEQPEIPMVNGRLTTSLAVKVAGGDGSPYTAGPGTPTGGQFRQTFTPRECPKSGCPQPQVGVDGYLPQRRWSDAASWPDGKLPVAMDNVVLPPTDNVLLDIVTPKLHWVDIQGKLEFDRALNTTLNAHSLKVWGKLEMGTVENPMPAANKAEIVLWGAEQAITVIMVEGLFLVNKVIAVLGEFSAVGTPRTSKAWTRLSQTAAAGATQLTVQGTVTDWRPGSQVAISATEYPSPPQTTETEVRTISAEPVYDAATDTTTLTLSAALTHRHFAGVIDSSAENIHWPQPFLAAAVALLDGRSNVVIRTGEEFEEHGGDVVIGGSSDGRWAGIATISNVDFIRMGKFWYQAPALKFNFLGGQKNMSRVENCVFSHSQSGAIEANYVSNLEIVDNVFHRTTRTAVWIRGTSSQDAIVLRRNVAIETLRHPSENTEWIRHFGAYYLEVRPAVLAGNVAAGSCDTGFILRPQLAACQKGDAGNARLQQEDLNEAVATMTGVFILDGCQGQCNDCAQVHGLVAWKSAHGGIMSGDQNANVRLDTILLADNHIGIGLRFLRSTADMDHRTYSYNVSVYGSTPASTCDASIDCRAYGETDAVGLACNSVLGDKYRRVGIMTHMMNNIPKFCEAKGVEPCRPPTTPIKMCVMPWEERMGSAGSRYSESHWDGITFGHWAADDCGRPSVAFTYNPTNIDVAYPQFFTGVVWLPTVEANAKVFLGESTITHNSVTATGEFDGVNQLVLTDVDGSLLGTTSRDASMVTVYNPALAIQSCTEVASSYFDCPDLQLRLLTWEAVGGPSHRVLSKFKAWRASDDRSTWSAGPQEEKACLPVGAEHDRSWKIRPNDLYNLTMFTSPPKNHRLFWFNDNPDETIRLDIFLTQPFRLEVYVDEVLMSEDLYDTAKKSPSRLPELTDPHGSYAFDPQARRFYLIMQGGIFNGKAATIGGGFISLRLLQVVQITMSVAIPLADFDSVEQNKFVNNVATLLQIPASRIKIVSVQSKAQVAAQGGRLLQVVEAVEIEVEDAGRNLQDEGVEVIFQVIEDETVSGGTGGPGADEFSGAAILELQSLIETLLNASETGTLSSFLGFNVVLESVELTDVPTDATDNTAGNSTVTQTTVTTTFTSTATTSTSTTDPNSTTEATEEPIEDPTGALVQSILIGAVVGIGVGVLMMIIGYLVRRRMYSRNVHASYSEGQQEALNP